MLYDTLRPLLFQIDPEKIHEIALTSLDKFGRLLPSCYPKSEPVQVMGITFPNRVGLAAGFDKNGVAVDGLGKLGFGHIEVGTVTPKPQSGNPKPRLFRLKDKSAIINRMGFNNYGVDTLIKNLEKSTYKGVLGINIGKNKVTPNDAALDDYLTCLRKVYARADYVTINISSPNTKGLRDLQAGDQIKQLIDGLKTEQERLKAEYGHRPIAIKIAPDLNDQAIIELAQIFKERDVDGIIATNTTIDRSKVLGELNAEQEGGLSGKPLTNRSTEVIKILSNEIGKQIPIIGVGGIMDVNDALDKIASGASLVQLYSGFIYQGPGLVHQIIKRT